MKIDRTPDDSFKPYSIVIRIEDARDASILKNMLMKLEYQVKRAGVYDDIIRQLLAALGN